MLLLLGQNYSFSLLVVQSPTENQQYIWIPEIMCKLQADKISAPLNTLPVVKGTRKITSDNFMSAMYMLGK